jgi:tryptophan halogenase
MTGTEDRRIASILIVGGGSAGWMTAAALANALQKDCTITLIESDEIGTVGVGEATIPTIRLFNQTLGIDEAEFVRATNGSFKLGIQFVDWGKRGHQYFHPFGTYGRPFDTADIHQHWIAARAAGHAFSFDDLCMAWAAAKDGKFAHPTRDPRSVMSTFDYAYHFDAGLYARFLRGYSETRGVTRIEGKIAGVNQNSETGFVNSVTMADGQCIGADLFIDCSGFRGLLITEALKTPFEDWSHWLPCNRAVAMPCENIGEPTPYTRSTAREAGWQWRIPLQHRTGNGYVYCSDFLDDDKAAELLASRLDGKALGDPRTIRFTAGRRTQHWNKNVIAVGLSSGFLEPLESTAIHLIQANISKLLALFPDKTFDPATTAEFNHIATTEMERIRDFIILHYKLNTRDDAELWRHAAAMDIPDTLQLKIDHFRHNGRLIARDMDLFGPASWAAVQIGQGNIPEQADPMLAYRTADGVQWLERLQAAMMAEAKRMPSHQQFIDQLIKAPAA